MDFTSRKRATGKPLRSSQKGFGQPRQPSATSVLAGRPAELSRAAIRELYTRAIVGEKDLPPPKDAELTQTGWEFYPEALEHTVRYAAQKTGVPILVTENGIATDEDERRIKYIHQSVAGVQRCLDDHVDVRGYIHWSLIDNLEWNSGFNRGFRLGACFPSNVTFALKTSRSVRGPQ